LTVREGARLSIVRYPTPLAALNAEAALADEFDGRSYSGIFSLWGTTRCLIVPRSAARKPNFEEARERSRKAGWPVFVRPSGGSIVFQDHGTLNLSVFLDSNGASIESVYQILGTPIIETLRGFGVNAGFGVLRGSLCDGRYNILIGGKKFAGASQYWPGTTGKQDAEKRSGILAHALCFIDSDMVAGIRAVDNLSRSLRLPDGFEPSRHVNMASVVCNRGPVLTNVFAEQLLLELQNNGWNRSSTPTSGD